jgi:hypothetical protein
MGVSNALPIYLVCRWRGRPDAGRGAVAASRDRGVALDVARGMAKVQPKVQPTADHANLTWIRRSAITREASHDPPIVADAQAAWGFNQQPDVQSTLLNGRRNERTAPERRSHRVRVTAAGLGRGASRGPAGGRAHQSAVARALRGGGRSGLGRRAICPSSRARQPAADTRRAREALDAITEECRRLEDVLEDQHLVFDGLRKEVERRDLSLKAAQDEVGRLRQALLDLQAQASEPAMREAAPPRGPVRRGTSDPASHDQVRPLAAASTPGARVARRLRLAACRSPAGPRDPGDRLLVARRTKRPRSARVRRRPGPNRRRARRALRALSVPTRRDRLRNGGYGPMLASSRADVSGWAGISRSRAISGRRTRSTSRPSGWVSTKRPSRNTIVSPGPPAVDLRRTSDGVEATVRWSG